MALSKRLRYEILRRDNHTCRYCGATAPDVKLTVDHVIPQALGGSDEPSNLVTACSPCNSGKSASSPDAPIVADIDQRAIEWAAAMAQAQVDLAADRERRETILDQFAAIWYGHTPSDWEQTILSLVAAGLDIETLTEMANVAQSARGLDSRWRYFCGCCWNRVRELRERASEILQSQPQAEPPVAYWNDEAVAGYHDYARNEFTNYYGYEPTVEMSGAHCGGERPWCGDYRCLLESAAWMNGALFASKSAGERNNAS